MTLLIRPHSLSTSHTPIVVCTAAIESRVYMTSSERGVWRVINKGLSTNDKNSPEEVLGWALDLGLDIGVSDHRVREIFKAILDGIKPGTHPL